MGQLSCDKELPIRSVGNDHSLSIRYKQFRVQQQCFAARVNASMDGLLHRMSSRVGTKGVLSQLLPFGFATSFPGAAFAASPDVGAAGCPPAAAGTAAGATAWMLDGCVNVPVGASAGPTPLAACMLPPGAGMKPGA